METYRDGEADVHTEEDDADEGRHAGEEVELVHLEEAVDLLVLDQSYHGRDDDGREGHKGGVLEERRQEEEDHHHARGHHHVRHRRPAPGAVVDC